jgi:hypothetical protein
LTPQASDLTWHLAERVKPQEVVFAELLALHELDENVYARNSDGSALQ